eukprot:756133-Hanusia_phi.AAC.6
MLLVKNLHRRVRLLLHCEVVGTNVQIVGFELRKDRCFLGQCRGHLLGLGFGLGHRGRGEENVLVVFVLDPRPSDLCDDSPLPPRRFLGLGALIRGLQQQRSGGSGVVGAAAVTCC